MLLIAFLLINTKKKPFVSVPLNDLETYSLASSMVTIYCGLFFISDTASFSIAFGKSELILSEEVKMFFFLIIVSVNLIFFFFWLYKMYIQMKLVMSIRLSKIYLFFCLCNNK
mmetsp:Transcript_34101/g.33290  ORF Transcript_34101/g.33290 Transcript_34101/m.33290 type:complete len:113 (+) Transcript_34101:242-580(+)